MTSSGCALGWTTRRRCCWRRFRPVVSPLLLPRLVNVNVNNLLAISKLDFDNSGEPGPQAKVVNHLETPLRQLHATHRASSCAKRVGHVQLCSKPRGGTRNRTRDLPKKGSAFITSSDQTGPNVCMYVCMYDYIVVSTRTLTPPTSGTD